ncbi:MAG: polysaccharide biosynthesis protein [Acidiferrobacterales bacterium]
MARFTPLKNRALVTLHDLVAILLAWLGAFWLRFNLQGIPPEFLHQAALTLPVVFMVQGSMFWYFGLYRGVWRFASLPDLIRILKAAAAGVSISAVAIFVLTRLTLIPRSVFVLDGLLLVLLLGGPRFVFRWIKDRHLYGKTGKKVLIVGAGRAGEMLVRDLLRDPERSFQPVAFVDDDPGKRQKDIHGIPVAGTVDEMPAIAADLDVELILFALPSANSAQIRRIVGVCESTGIPFRMLPRMEDLVTGQIGMHDLREVKLDDLLGREAVSLDWQAITRGMQGKIVLVSGGGGSIGSELCRQIARLDPARLIILEQSEFNLYTIELELRREFPDLPLVVFLGSVADAVAVEQVLGTHRPNVIFHAAAYKHVPMLEGQVRAAVVNNVLGTRCLASLADKYDCEAFVMISTDKAVNPSNVMGATKRVAEIYCQGLDACSNTRFITVRFGNVLGSAGSVIPLFQKQIAAGGPVTVTHPQITRYFMTIPEAAQLILQASVIGQGGEIFVLDMGEPVQIAYLAEQLILLSGKKPGDDIEIVFTGLRPGEKLYEELFHEAEQLVDTGHPKIMLARSRPIDAADMEEIFAELSRACDTNTEPRLRELLRMLVPEQAEQGAAAHGPAETRDTVNYPWKDPAPQPREN